MAGINYASLETLRGIVEGIEENYAKAADLASYSISKNAAATAGYAATYQMTKDGTPVGDAINIPKDYTVKDASIKTAAADNSPVAGCKAGDKYVDFVVNTVGGDGNETHLYLLVGDMVKPYTPGNGINISDANAVSLKLDASKSNGLSVGANGLALAAATASSPGAMSAADKAKLDGMTFTEIPSADAKALVTSAG